MCGIATWGCASIPRRPLAGTPSSPRAASTTDCQVQRTVSSRIRSWPLRTGRAAALCAAALVVGSCASPRVVLPVGAGTPLPDYTELFDAAADPCRRVRTLEFVLAIEGETGDTRLRGRVRGALERPAALRLEGIAPFGAPAFVLVAGEAPAVLLLPRQRRVVTDATGKQLLELLAGLPLGPADLRAVLTGCLLPDPLAVGASTYRNGWVGVHLQGGATLFVNQVDGEPVIVAGRRNGLSIVYGDHTRGMPRRIHLRTSASAGVITDVTATLSQVSINVEIDERAFAALVPVDFTPTSIETLRPDAGPLAVPDEAGPRTAAEGAARAGP